MGVGLFGAMFVTLFVWDTSCWFYKSTRLHLGTRGSRHITSSRTYNGTKLDTSFVIRPPEPTNPINLRGVCHDHSTKAAPPSPRWPSRLDELGGGETQRTKLCRPALFGTERTTWSCGIALQERRLVRRCWGWPPRSTGTAPSWGAAFALRPTAQTLRLSSLTRWAGRDIKES
ncbi:hypothetical protein IWZ01DRAFT_345210 [Phyllosticta capitalensis]